MTLLRSLMRYVAFMAMSALSFSTLTYSSPHLSGHTFLYSSLIPAAAGDCPVAQNLTVISYTTGDVIVTWDHPVSGPPSEGYSLRFNYILPDGTIDYSGNVGGNPNIPSSSTSITDELTPGYTYRAILVAEDNFCGNTPYAFYDFEIPLPQNCEPVRDPSASDITNSSVRLYWNHPTDVSDIQNYILRYSEVGGSDNGSTTVGLNSTNAAITGLQSSTTYSTQVCTLCDDGTETCVNAGTITTQSDQQYSCSQLQVDIIGGNGSICQGTEITLKTDVRYGSGPYEYDWSNGKTTSQITVTPNSGTAYYSVTVTDANNCTDSDIVSFYVSAPSTNDAEPEITTAATMTCGNSLVSLSVNDGSTQASQALQAYYPFQADMADHSGNNRNLSGDRGILTGGGLQLLSSGTAISSPVISSAQYYQTVSFYLKFLETPNGSRQKIFSFEPSNLESPSIWKRANDMGIDWQYDSQNKGSFGDFNLTLNRWYHIVGRKSGQDFKLYVDGQLEKQVTLSNTYTTSGAPLVFGDAAVVIKEFKFYSRSLSYDEIGGNWVWYTNNSGSSPPIGTGQTIDVLPTATTTYYVRWESNCSYSAWAYHTISVVTPPSIDITAGNTDLCVGNSTNLTASTGGGIGCTTVKWEIKPDGTEDWEPVSGTNTGNTIPVPTDLDPGIYHFRAKYFCSESCGTATSNVITININANERVPTITGTPEPVCSGGTIQLRVEDATTEDASLQVFYPFENDLNDHLGSLHLTGSGGTLTGEGLQLTNSSAYASPYTDILDTDEHTISFDIKYNSGFDELAYHRIFYFNPLNSDRSPGIFRHRWNNGIHWRYSPGNYGVATGADLGVNQWHSIVGVKDGPLFTLYVDGHFVESASVPDPKSEGSGYLRFGGSEVVIRNFKAYNRSFTAKEIVGEWAWYTSNDPNSAPFDYGAEIEVSPDVTTTYYVRWLNDCGTSAPAEITVDVTADPSVTISEENADPPTLPIGICEGETRTLTASLSGGLDCNQPQWWSRVGTSGTWIATGNFTTELVVTADLAPGNYQYLVKYTCNGLGCEVATSNTITVTVSPYPEVTNIAVADPACGQNNGSITFLFPDRPERTGIQFSKDGGNSYTHTNEDLGTFTFTDLAPGTYPLWVRWGNLECPIYLTDITLEDQPGPFLRQTADQTVCLGDSYTFSPAVLSGTPPFTYTWEDGSTGNSRAITPVTTQDYALTVTDANGCTATDIITVNVLEGPRGAISKQDATCDQDNGAASIRVSGGYQPYTYAWSNGGTVPTIRDLPSGNYTVTVSDANGCNFTAATEVIDLGILPTVDAGADQTICFGESITLTATAVEGDPEFEYHWSMGAVGQSVTFSPESSAVYTVTLTDGYGCSTTDEVTVNVLPELTVDFYKTNAVNDQADGSIQFEFEDAPALTTLEFSIDGGNTYPYSTDDAIGSFAVEGLAAGDYDTHVRWAGTNCVVALGKISILSDLVDDTYVSGCNDATILESQSLITETDLLTDAEIIDEAGRIFCTEKLTDQAGVKWYKWLVDDPGTFGFTITPLDPSHDIDFVLFELPAGINNCEPKIPVRQMGAGLNDGSTTSSCSGATGLADGQTDTEEDCGCTGDADGFLAPVYLEQGASYALVVINWSDPAGGFTLAFEGIEQFATAVPLDLCSEQPGVPIGEISYECVSWSPTYGLTPIGDPNQPGRMIATPPFTTTYIQTITNSEGEIISALPYTVEVYDIGLSIYPSEPVICGDGSVTLEALTWGDNSNYSYDWSNGATTSSIIVEDVSSSSTYTVTVTDNDHGCYETASISVVNGGVEASIDAETTALCSGQSVVLTATYTLPPRILEPENADISYVWSTGAITATTTVTEPGTYTVTVTYHETGCTDVAEVTLDDLTAEITISPEAPFLCSTSLGTVELSTESGHQFYDWQYRADPDQPYTSIGSGADLYVFPAAAIGFYRVVVTDNNGCTAVAEVEVADGSNNPAAIQAYFESRGFYSLDIEIGLDAAARSKEQNKLEKSGDCDLMLNNSVANDLAQKQIRVLSDASYINDLGVLVQQNLDYFNSEFGYTDSRAFITSNDNLCSCNNFLSTIETAFEGDGLAFWMHLYEAGDGQDKLYLLTNVPTQEQHYPESPDRIAYMDSGVKYLKAQGGTISAAVINSTMDHSLDNSPDISPIGEDPAVQNQSSFIPIFCGNTQIKENESVVCITPSCVAVKIPGPATIRFKRAEDWDIDRIPEGSLAGFTDRSNYGNGSGSLGYYGARFDMSDQVGGYYKLLGYYPQLITEDFEVNGKPYEFEIPGSGDKATLGMFPDGLKDRIRLETYNIASPKTFVETGAGYAVEDLFDSCPAVMGEPETKQTFPNPDYPNVKPLDQVDISNSTYDQFGYGGVFIKTEINGVGVYLYVLEIVNNNGVSEAKAFIWNCYQSIYEEYPMTTQLAAQFELKLLEEKYDVKKQQEPHSENLTDPVCFDISKEAVQRVGDFSQMPLSAPVNYNDLILDYAGVDQQTIHNIQEGIQHANDYQVSVKYFVTSEKPGEVISGDPEIAVVESPRSAFESEPLSVYNSYDKDVAVLITLKEDGSAEFCVRFAPGFFEQNANINDPEKKITPEIAAELRLAFIEAIQLGLEVKKKDVEDTHSDNDPHDFAIPDDPDPDKNPWFFGLRPAKEFTSMEQPPVNFATVTGEVIGVGRSIIRDIKMPEQIWKFDQEGMFRLPAGIIGVGDGLISENPIAGTVEGVKFGISFVKDEQVRDGMVEAIKHPIRTVRGIYDQKVADYTGQNGKDQLFHTAGVDVVGIIYGLGAVKGLLDKMRARKSPDGAAQKVADETGDLPEPPGLSTEQLHELYQAFKDKFGDAVYKEEVQKFLEFVGDKRHLVKFVDHPDLFYIWDFLRKNGDATALDNFKAAFHKFPDGNPDFYEEFLDAFLKVDDVDGNLVASEKVKFFLQDLKDREAADFLGEFVSNPKLIEAWTILFPDNFLRKNPQKLQKVNNYASDFGKSFDEIGDEFKNVPASQRDGWIDHLEFRTRNNKVNKAGGRSEDYTNYNKNSELPEKYRGDDRVNDLSYDPATKSVKPKEAMTGLEAESQGLIDGPISRDPTGNFEFIDSNGNPVDVKAPRGGFVNSSQVGGSIKTQLLDPDVKVLFDTTWIDNAELSSIRSWLQANLNSSDLQRIIEVNSNLN